MANALAGLNVTRNGKISYPDPYFISCVPLMNNGVFINSPNQKKNDDFSSRISVLSSVAGFEASDIGKADAI